MTEMTKEDVRDSANVALMLDQEVDRRIMVAIIRMLRNVNTTAGVHMHITDTAIENADDYGLSRMFLGVMADCLDWEGTMGSRIAKRMEMEMRDNFLKQMPDLRITYKGTIASW